MIRIAVLVSAIAALPCCQTSPALRFPVKDSLELSGNLLRPEGDGPFPAVVLMHGCGGVSGDSSEEVSKLLRDSGYVAFVVDSFSGRHVSNVCSPGEFRMDGGKSPAPPERVEDAFAARRYLSPLAFVDSSRIGLLGWCDGGTTALMTWTRDSVVSGTLPFAAIAAYFPYCCDADIRGGAPLLILIGERDDWHPASKCKDLVTRATALGIDASITIYPGADHAFDGAYTGSYLGHSLARDPAAARNSRMRLLAFFERTLKKE